MPLPNASEKLIQMGSFCNVAIYDENGTREIVGLVQNASYNEDFGVAPANVVGYLGPISHDAQNYSCQITIGNYVPLRPREAVTEPYLDGGETTFAHKLKTRSDIALTGKGTVIPQMDFIDRQSGVIINSFNQVIITNSGTQIGANAYVTSNMQFLAIERTL